jgi:outer membrane assembly lipoprotein YfiO
MRTSLKLAAFAVLLFWAVSAQAQWTWTPQTGRFVNMKRMPKETAELQIEYTRGLLVEGSYRKAMRETEKFTEFYGKDAMADENQFLRAEILMAQGKSMDAAKAYQQLLAGYPGSKRYQEAIKRQYEIGDQYYEKGLKKIEKRWALFKKRPLKHAAEVYAMVVENQPFTAEAAEAQYKIGLSHYARREYIEAAFEYRRVVEDYSGSDWVDEASYGLAMCYYKGSLKPAYDQTPSQMAVDAIDDFAVRYPQDERVADLKSKRGEMRESIANQRLATARFYEKRRDFSSARIYYELLAKDFTDTGASQTAKEWLDNNAGVTHVGMKYGKQEAR